MKWFTRDREYEYVEGEPDPTHEAYRAHIAELRPLLPEGLKRLAEGGGNLSLHDGSFIRASKDPENVETVVVDIRCWDMPEGRLVNNVWIYPALHVRIVYYQATLVQQDRPEWPAFGDSHLAHPEILDGELDRSGDDRFVHRMLVWPESAGFISVEFATAELVAVRFTGAHAEVLET